MGLSGCARLNGVCGTLISMGGSPDLGVVLGLAVTDMMGTDGTVWIT